MRCSMCSGLVSLWKCIRHISSAHAPGTFGSSAAFFSVARAINTARRCNSRKPGENLAMGVGDPEALRSAATATGQASSWQVVNSRMRLKVGT